jgi:hypothetical protein
MSPKNENALGTAHATRARWIRRKYQQVALVAVRKTRILGLFWARQCRKSTTLGDIAFDEMSRTPGRNVIAASASLLLGTELVSKTVTATEQAIIVGREAAAMSAALENSVADSKKALQLVTANAETGKVYQATTADEFTDLYKSGRLEMRLMFDRTEYSRLRVIAPNPATARGWTGTVLRDEIGFIRNESEVQTAVKPIIDTDPSFKMVYASNLPDDDRHPWFAMTLPLDPSLSFRPDASGHFYRGQTGLRIHRVDIADAYASGHVLYNDDGKALTLEAFLASESNKSMLRQNYTLIHEYGGAAVIDSLCLHQAQKRGMGRCLSVEIDAEPDFEKALSWLVNHLKAGLPTGIGFDVASTEGGVSNPASLSVMQLDGADFVTVLEARWKSRHEDTHRDRLRRMASACEMTEARARRLCIDASNERLFAEGTRTLFSNVIPVELVLGGATVEPAPPGYEDPVNYKTYQGDSYSAAINANHAVLPPEPYFRDDHLRVVKDRGVYKCEVDRLTGGHGDTFDSGKQAKWAIENTSGAIRSMAGIEWARPEVSMNA